MSGIDAGWLLEDEDGAPYPEDVQRAFRTALSSLQSELVEARRLMVVDFDRARAAEDTVERILTGVTDVSGLPGAPLAVPIYRETQRFAEDEFAVGAYNDGIDAAMLAVERAIKGSS